MKMRYLLIGILFLFGCNGRLDDMRPHNMAEAETYLRSFNNILAATSGLYGQFQSAAGGYTETTLYHVSYHVLGEFRGNNIIFSEPFTSWSIDYLRGPDAHFFLNSDQKERSHAWSLWAKTNQLVLGASRNIIAIDNLMAEMLNPDPELRSNLIRLKGENAFLRGLMIFNATNVFGRPYWDEPDVNPGIPLDIDAMSGPLKRSNVKTCFEQIVADFKMAAACLPEEEFDRTFANKAAAYGMLSRAYLYMGGLPEAPNDTYNRLAVQYADSTLDLEMVEILEGEDLKNLYDLPKTNREILFAFSPANFPGSQWHNLVHNYYGTAGYSYTYNCIISHDYEELMEENDLRWQYFTEFSDLFEGRYRTKKYDGGEYTSYTTNYACPVVFIRAGEVVLNRAEAYVKLGEDDKALTDLNWIRKRAGLSPLTGLTGEKLFNEIFDERRRELAFEAQTYYDYVRNGISMKRKEISTVYANYTGEQYNEMNPRISRKTVCLIPEEELLLNKELVQNEY